MIAQGTPLSRHTSFKVGGPPDRWAVPASEEALRETLVRCAETGEAVRALGGGKNLLVDDRGVEGTVIGFAGLRAVRIDGDLVVAQAGVSLPALMTRCVGRGLAGLDGLAGVPGTVGGAVRMNAGGVHGTIGERVEWVRGFTLRGEPFSFAGPECGFRYRGSRFADLVIVEVGLRLSPSGEDLRARVKEIIAKKSATQPLWSATAGCTFKNPPGGESAGRLLDRAGVKGLVLGGARYSTLHANFIENTGGGTFGDIMGLIAEGRRRVREQSGVELELEVEVWPRVTEGAFAAVGGAA